MNLGIALHYLPPGCQVAFVLYTCMLFLVRDGFFCIPRPRKAAVDTRRPACHSEAPVLAEPRRPSAATSGGGSSGGAGQEPAKSGGESKEPAGGRPNPGAACREASDGSHAQLGQPRQLCVFLANKPAEI